MHIVPKQMRYQAALLPDADFLGVRLTGCNRLSERNGTGRRSAAHLRRTIPHIENGPRKRANAAPALTMNLSGGTMADPLPKSILPLLEGKIGELRIMRFWSKVDMRHPDECWEWQASRHGKGYGRFKITPYETVTASRMALISTKREEPFGLHVLHRCDNPPCCNPHHLYFGTVAENAADKVARGRATTGDQAGASNGAAKLTDEQITLIVQRLKAGWNNKRIAADLPVGHSMISLIRLGRMWGPTTAALGWTPKTQFTRLSPAQTAAAA